VSVFRQRPDQHTRFIRPPIRLEQRGTYCRYGPPTRWGILARNSILESSRRPILSLHLSIRNLGYCAHVGDCPCYHPNVLYALQFVWSNEEPIVDTVLRRAGEFLPGIGATSYCAHVGDCPCYHPKTASFGLLQSYTRRPDSGQVTHSSELVNLGMRSYWFFVKDQTNTHVLYALQFVSRKKGVARCLY
jgi:hypothetical protein